MYKLSHKNKQKLKSKNKTKNKISTCKIYKSCEHVPCGATMNKCTPSYCVPGSSRNWSFCNMANWGYGYERHRSTCNDESKCKMSKNNIKTKNTVDALLLHHKMPYIWRFLKPKTRKYMIELANMPIDKINIGFHVFPDLHKNTTINKMIKNMTKKNRKHFINLRKKYKNI